MQEFDTRLIRTAAPEVGLIGEENAKKWNTRKISKEEPSGLKKHFP